jgi:pimeloyl-ACP methyl ester carboxylesterase
MPFPSAAARAAACLEVKPTIRLDWIEGAGHWLQYERAAAVNRLLADFLSGTKQNQTAERGLGYAI